MALTLVTGMIIGSPNSTYKVGISPDKRESLSISAFGIANFNSFVLINFLVKTNKKVNFENIDNKISYCIISNDRKVYNSESISKDGQFKTANIPASLLQPTFDIYFKNSSQQTIVSRNETVQTFTEPNNRIYMSLNVNNCAGRTMGAGCTGTGIRCVSAIFA